MANITFDLNFDLRTLDEVDTQENNGRFANLVEKDLIHRNDLVQKSCKMPSEVKDAKTWIRTRV